MKQNYKDFRIGNLVMYDNRVFEINVIAEEFPTLNTEEFGIGVVDWNNVTPIPLTDEWMVKLGFIQKKPKGILWFIQNKARKINLVKYHGNGKYTFPFNENGLKTIDYLHQLQNLYYALTNTELLLKNK